MEETSVLDVLTVILSQVSLQTLCEIRMVLCISVSVLSKAITNQV